MDKANRVLKSGEKSLDFFVDLSIKVVHPALRKVFKQDQMKVPMYKNVDVFDSPSCRVRRRAPPRHDRQ